MTNRAEATARPWKAEPCGDEIWIVNESGIEIATTVFRGKQEESDAALIVEAVNAWDDAAALRARLAQLDITPRVNSHDTLLEQRDKLTAMLAKCVERLKRELVTYEYGAPMLDALITEAESLLAEIRGGK